MPGVANVIEANRSARRFGQLQYPAAGGTHGMIMNFYDYSFRGGAVANVNAVGSIALPLPQNIDDVTTINIKSSELGISGSVLAELASGDTASIQAAISAMQEAGKSAAGIAADVAGGDFGSATGALSTASSAAMFATRAGLSSILPGFGDALSAASGTAVNPHATLVFDGVQLKKFNLVWQFAPKTNTESIILHNIIRTIKKKILPTYDRTGSAFSRGILNYPKMVDFGFVGIDESRIFKFKRSMIDSFNVSYSPNGNVFNKGSGTGSDPAFINFNIGFTESEIWTSEDY